jgi:hypothetical protein
MSDRKLAFIYSPEIELLSYPPDCPFKTQRAGLTRQQVADAFDRLQADVSFSASGQTLAVRITTRRSRLPAVVELVGKLLRDPAYAPEPLEEARRQWLTGIERLEVVVHELIHRHQPYLDESEVEKLGLEIAIDLWEHGWRQVRP